MNREQNEQTRSKEISEIEQIIIAFQEKFKSGTTESEKFITIHEIERHIWELQQKTNKIYRDMVCELMSNVDEMEIICKKKRIPAKRREIANSCKK